MFLEKHRRFFKQYDLVLKPRKGNAPVLPLSAPAGTSNIQDALVRQMTANQASETTANGDTIELLQVRHVPAENALILLFHRASPNAADPTYRKKAQAADGGDGAGQAEPAKFTIRTAEKEQGEEQSVSAHLVMRQTNAAQGRYRAVLEEIPGISMAAVRGIIAAALASYPYDFEHKKKPFETYTTIKAEGIKSETMEGALNSGHVDFITLTREAKPDFVDADGLFEPKTEVMKLKITGEVTPANFKISVGSLFKKAKAAGWEQFNIDVEFPDKRRRTVPIEKEQEAKELLFVRSEEAAFAQALSPCSELIVDAIANKAMAIAKLA